MFLFKAKRAIHTVPRLSNFPQVEKQGIHNILSQTGFKHCWIDQQKYLCDKLTIATAGTALESYLPFHIILNTAKRPFHTHIFNLASAAHNNHLFIENILPQSGQQAKSSPGELILRLQKQYGYGWEEMKDEMVRRAEEDVIGQGWLFLVENKDKEFHIMTVQNNGTPYYFPRNQLFDLNLAVTADEFSQWKTVENLTKEGEIEDWTIPIIAVSLWDHAYLHDYGVAGRKRYVQNVLNNLNWSVINNRLYTGN